MNILSKLLLAVTLFVFCLSLPGCYFFPREEPVLAPPLIKPDRVTYNVVEAVRGEIENSIRGSGYFVAEIQENLFFKFRGGRLKNIYVRLGDFVNKGDLVAELETDDLEMQIKQQEILVEKARLSYERCKIESPPGDDYNIKMAEMELESAMLQLEYLETELEKSRRFSASFETDKLEMQIKQQEILVEKARLSYERCKIESPPGDDYNIKMAEMELESAMLQMEYLETELEKSRLFSTISGKIIYISDSLPGDYVNAYQNLLRVADTESLLLEYKGDKAAYFSLGTEVEVNIDDKVYTGEVVFNASNAPIEELEKYKDTVRIKVEELPEDVRLGQKADIKLVIARKENALIIPRNSVYLNLGDPYIYVLENNVRTERYVKLGIESSTMVEIVEGLQDGELVIK